ncbi:MAG: efflux RND transporter periplasmic adaptor subunit [Sporocytophaga sp.]|nr:efflux RND transporter periplasmic adaptor subunit [Sporocytophaga sp.]
MKSNYKYFNIAIILLLVLLIASCKTKTDKHEDYEVKHDTIHTSAMYYCPMHPEVVSDKPGICPKCEMDLELAPQEIDTLSYLAEPTNQVVISSLKPIVPTINNIANYIKAEGYLTYNPNLTNSISARVSGRVEKLCAKFEFERVQKGQLLMEIYSPELQTAQNEYLLIYKSATDGEKEILDALYQKLVNLGMTASTIKALEKIGEVKATIPIYSPYSGHIHFLEQGSDIAAHGLVWPNSSNGNTMLKGSDEMKTNRSIIKEGSYVTKGDLIFTIANEKSVWAMFKILPRDIPFIKKGEYVEVKINNDTYNGNIEFIEKSFDDKNDFYTVRVYLKCDDHKNLIIGTLIEGNITVNKTQDKKILIPDLAVLHLGKSISAVFVKDKVGYVAKEVRTGVAEGGWTEVLYGLSENDSIAPVASYLVDSEAFLKVKQQ